MESQRFPVVSATVDGATRGNSPLFSLIQFGRIDLHSFPAHNCWWGCVHQSDCPEMRFSFGLGAVL